MFDQMHSYKLVRYRDAGMPTYTYFWIVNKTFSQMLKIDSAEEICSPYFESEEQAHAWINVKSRDE